MSKTEAFTEIKEKTLLYLAVKYGYYDVVVGLIHHDVKQ